MLHNKYYLPFAVGILMSTICLAQWNKETTYTTNNLNSIHFASEKSGWAVGDNGTMLFYNGSGWTSEQSVTEKNLFCVFMLSQDNVWSVGEDGIILNFNGNVWEEVHSPTKEKLLSVSFSDSENGTAVGANGTIIVFEDGKWISVKSNIRGNLFSVQADNTSTFIGGGQECISVPVMRFSRNSENILTKYFDPDFIEIKSIAFQNKKKMWAVGSPGTLMLFEGNNLTTFDQFNDLPSLNSICFSDDQHGISVGYGGTILTYENNLWTKETSPVDIRLNCAFIKGNTIYAVGNDGTILSKSFKTGNSDLSSDKLSTEIKITSYPNPSKEVLMVEIPNVNNFLPDRLTITNVFGQVVYSQRIFPGNDGYLYRINTNELNNGLYLIKISSHDAKKRGIGKFMVRH